MLIAASAAETNTVVAELKMVPNEPLIFHNDGVKRKEDDLIAYTWDQFLKGGRRRMAGPAADGQKRRPCDGLHSGAAGQRGRRASSRSTNSSSPADRSAAGRPGARPPSTSASRPSFPISIDCLNSAASMRHHVAVYGFYTEAVGDYFNHKIVQRVRPTRG